MKSEEQNKGSHIVYSYSEVQRGGRNVWLEKPDGTLKCIGVLMPTIKSKG